MNQYQEYSKIFRSWEVTRLIGSGSYGKVFEMERREEDVVYKSALKVISIPQNDSEIRNRIAEGGTQESIAGYYGSVARQLLNEIRIMADLKGNSNIVSYEDHQVIYHEDGIGCNIFIRMELLTSFIDYMAENDIDEQTIIRLGIDMCKALEICDWKNIIHRDIKPGNIFVSGTGDFKLGDFGIARTIEKTEGGLSKKGTYRYMAPEVYKGEAYGKTVDICSLGLVLYYLANGKRTPFLPDATMQVSFHDEEEALLRRMRGERMMPPKHASNDLSSIILKACSYNAEERYADAAEMRKDLEALSAGKFVKTSATRGLDDVTVAGWNSPVKSEAASTVREKRKQAEIGTMRRDQLKESVRHPMQAARQPAAATYQAPYDNPRENKKKSGRNGKTSAVIVSIIAVALIALIVAFALLKNNDIESGDTRTAETEYTPMESVDSTYLTVLCSDWDWDSGEENSDGTYHVDGGIYIENKSDADIVEIEFFVKDKNGSIITNAENGDDRFKAYGYIDAGCKGMMIADVSTFKEKVRPDDDTYVLTQAFTNPALEDYQVPSGRITKNYGPNNDYYDVSLDNRNDMETNQTALIVTMVVDGNTIVDFDATGRLDTSIPAQETGFMQEIAFIDPHLNKKKDIAEYRVFAIDRELYETYSEK